MKHKIQYGASEITYLFEAVYSFVCRVFCYFLSVYLSVFFIYTGFIDFIEILLSCTSSTKIKRALTLTLNLSGLSSWWVKLKSRVLLIARICLVARISRDLPTPRGPTLPRRRRARHTWDPSRYSTVFWNVRWNVGGRVIPTPHMHRGSHHSWQSSSAWSAALRHDESSCTLKCLTSPGFAFSCMGWLI